MCLCRLVNFTCDVTVVCVWLLIVFGCVEGMAWHSFLGDQCTVCLLAALHESVSLTGSCVWLVAVLCPASVSFLSVFLSNCPPPPLPQHTHTNTCMHTDTHTHTHTCMHAHMHACLYARARTHTHIHARLHACMLVCACTHIHTHTHAHFSLSQPHLLSLTLKFFVFCLFVFNSLHRKSQNFLIDSISLAWCVHLLHA